MIAKTIANSAKLEAMNKSEISISRKIGQFRSDLGEDGVSRKVFVPGKMYNYIVDIYDNPVSLADFRRLKPNLRATKGYYTIQYLPAASTGRNPKFPYLIGQDLVRIRVTVSGPKHWRALCDRIPELAWVNRNSTISPELFGIAKKHPGLVLRFGIKFVEYCDKITNRAKELGVDIDNKPLVTYQWGKFSIPHEEETLTMNSKKTYAEILKQLQDESKGEE